VQFAGEISLVCSDTEALWSAYEANPEAVFQVLEESIADTIDGVSSEDVHVYALLQQRRRLGASLAQVRALQTSGTLTVSYAIILSAQDAFDLGIDSSVVVNSTSQNLASSLTTALVANADTLGLDAGSISILGVSVSEPQTITGDIAANPPTTTVTTTSATSTTSTTSSTTTTTSTQPEPIEEEVSPLLIGGIGGAVFALIALLCCAVCCWRNCSRPEKGSIYLRFLGRKARFHVVEDGQKDDDGKIHVVWDVDMNRVENYFKQGNPTSAQQEEQDNPSSSTRTEEGESSDQIPSENRNEVEGVQVVPPSQERVQSSWSMAKDSQDAGFLDNLMNAVDDAVTKLPLILPDGAAVEYYSATHKRWLAGDLKVQVRGEDSTEVVYNVRIKAGSSHQLRMDVQPNSFRAPLRDGEKVDVYTGENGWLPGVVVRSHRPLLHGYGVTLDSFSTDGAGAISGAGSPSRTRTVAPARVRRRFLAGDKVMLYKGPAFGWEQVIVDDEASPDQAQLAELSVMTAVLRPTPSDLSIGAIRPDPTVTLGGEQVPASVFADLRDQGVSVAEEIDSQLQMWTLVSVHDKSGGPSRMVPSYLLNSDSRQVALWTLEAHPDHDTSDIDIEV